jgi:nitrogen fixation/metabolism regulation signal transduction histidine kinase
MVETKATNRTMATWVAAIADNVMNPVAGIGAALAIAEQQLAARRAGEAWDADQVDRSLQMIRARLGSLTEYVAELADFAKPAALSPATLDLAEELAAVLIAVGAPERYLVDIETRIAAGANRLVADQSKLRLVLKALILNAVQAVAGIATPRVLVAAEPGALPGCVLLSVEDNGKGLDPEAQTRVPEPFFSTKEAGTGLGLSIARKYVEAHGGKLAIDRSPALHGCRVTLSFPPLIRDAKG